MVFRTFPTLLSVNCAKRLFPSGRLGFQMFVRPSVRPSVRDFGDFCEGYKRVLRGHIRLGKNPKSCAEKTWFLRRVQASWNGPDPPRQFFRSQIRVLKKNLHKLRFANRNPSGLDPFLDLLFGAKNQLFSLFFAKKNKKAPQYTHAGNDQNDRKLELRATCHAGCYLVYKF